jgi:hypothetical protein
MSFLNGLHPKSKFLAIELYLATKEQKNLAVGVDGVIVQQARREERVIRIDLSNQLAALPGPWQDSFPLELRVTGLPDADGFQLILNGAAPINVSAAALASLRLNVRADGVEIVSSP